jgi:Tol biopolymer transport system component
MQRYFAHTRASRTALAVTAIALWSGLAAAEDGPREISISPQPASVAFSAVFSPDGSKIAIACEDQTVAIHDARTGRRTMRLKGHSQRVWKAVFSPDGKRLASCSGEYSKPLDPGEVKVWDLKTGREAWTSTGHAGLVFDVAFTPDGRRLLSASWDKTIKVWDAATGKLKQTLTGHRNAVRFLVFSPDGKTLASSSFDGTVRLWDASKLTLKKSFSPHAEGVQAIAFSPDGKLLATTAQPKGSPKPGIIQLWDVATLKRGANFGGFRGPVLSVCFSPDGRSLAASGGWVSSYGEVKLFETASGSERLVLPQHREWVESVRFSPNGRLLISAGGLRAGIPGEVHLLALRPKSPGKRKAVKRTGQELDGLWKSLAAPDAETGYKAVLALTASPKAAVTMFSERLQPPPKPDLKKIDRLVRQLDSDSFQEREAASRTLRKIGAAAAPALRRAVQGKPSLELRTRATQLLKRIDGNFAPPEQLRFVRAVEVLENCATPDAKTLLKKLAKSNPQSRLAVESQAALARLKSGSPKK